MGKSIRTDKLQVSRRGPLTEFMVIAGSVPDADQTEMKFDSPFFFCIGGTWTRVYLDTEHVCWDDDVLPEEEDCATFDDSLYSVFGALEGVVVEAIRFHDGQLTIVLAGGGRILIRESAWVEDPEALFHIMRLDGAAGLRFKPEKRAFPDPE